MGEIKRQDYDLAFTHLKSNQNISAHNLFTNLAETQKKTDKVKAALLFLLAAECKSKQNKNNDHEILEAGKLFLDFGTKIKSYEAKGALLCASKCFLRVGEYDDAKKSFNKAREFRLPKIEVSRPIIIIEDSQAVVMKLKIYLEKLGYGDCTNYQTGKEGIKECKKLISTSKNPIVLLDMGLPDIDGAIVASTLLEEKPDLPIILITADEKTTKRVSKTISSGVSAFIQKPFTIDEIKTALDIAEKDYSLSK
ncbi:MAG: Response regulator [Nitrosopumilales archaeon]|nr:MAG: Response regulator [Nitrosopumilales archaeon]